MFHLLRIDMIQMVHVQLMLFIAHLSGTPLHYYFLQDTSCGWPGPHCHKMQGGPNLLNYISEPGSEPVPNLEPGFHAWNLS